MAVMVYVLCALTSLIVAGLLWRGYRRSRANLLFWSAICFAFMTLGNLVLIVDVKVLPAVDLSFWRTLPYVIGIAVLLYGLVWDTR